MAFSKFASDSCCITWFHNIWKVICQLECPVWRELPTRTRVSVLGYTVPLLKTTGLSTNWAYGKIKYKCLEGFWGSVISEEWNVFTFSYHHRNISILLYRVPSLLFVFQTFPFGTQKKARSRCVLFKTLQSCLLLEHHSNMLL